MEQRFAVCNMDGWGFWTQKEHMGKHCEENSLMLIMIDLLALKGYAQGQTHLRISDNFKMTFTSNKES